MNLQFRGRRVDRTGILILATILVTGLLGGWAAYFFDADSRAHEAALRTRALTRACVLGVVGALCVALVLRILPNEIGAKIFDPKVFSSTDFPVWDYLVLIGLCLVMAFSAPRVLRWLGERLFGADQEPTTAPPRRPSGDGLKGHSGLMDAGPAEPAPSPAPLGAGHDPSDGGRPSQNRKRESVTPEERKALFAMMNRTYRTASGIAEDAGIPRHRISEILEALADKKLILATKSPRTGGARWAIGKRGREAIGGS